MQPVNSWNLLYAVRVFSFTVPDLNRKVPQENRDGIKRLAIAVQTDCATLGLRATHATAQRIVKRCDDDELTFAELTALCDDQFFGRLADEMSFLRVYAVEPHHDHLFQSPHPFGAEVSEAFPSAILDIEEAVQCLAFDRGTACVFHCMRVMEVGLRVLAKALGIPYAPSWESYLRQIQAQIGQDWKDKEPEWKQKERFYSEAAADLLTVKNAWRNPVMHVRGVYDPQRAADVFGAVRSFMRHLSKELREDPPSPTDSAS